MLSLHAIRLRLNLYDIIYGDVVITFDNILMHAEYIMYIGNIIYLYFLSFLCSNMAQIGPSISKFYNPFLLFHVYQQIFTGGLATFFARVWTTHWEQYSVNFSQICISTQQESL